MSKYHKLIKYIYPLIKNIIPANKDKLRILIFHDIPPSQEIVFKRQLIWLMKNWNIITPKEFEKIIISQEEVKGKHLLITFDDGFISNRNVAENILNPMGIKALFFVISDFVDINNKSDAHKFIAEYIMPEIEVVDIPDSMNNMQWEDLQTLNQQGHTIGCHTRKHAKLSTCSLKELNEEIIDSAACIREKLGISIEHFAYPFGDIDSFSKEAMDVAVTNFKYIYSGIRGDNINLFSPYTIRRDSAAAQTKNYEYIPLDNNLLDAFLSGTVDFHYYKARKLIDSWCN